MVDEFQLVNGSLLSREVKGDPRLAAPEESPPTPVRSMPLRPEPGAIVFAISGPITRSGIPGLCEHLRVLLERSDAHLIICDVRALADPDAATVDALARLRLTAQRRGRDLRLSHACGDLQRLLALMGLRDVLPLCAALSLQAERQIEQGEERGGVEEEADPGDPTA
jgi:ABC-type transporter Mla MlaB component